MPASGWIRKWTGAQAASAQADSLMRAAARGESLDQLLDLGAHALLAAGGADRVGLWLAGGHRGEPGQGCVVESVAGPVPDQWKRLDISTPFLRAALDNSEPMRVEFGASETVSHVGPLVGMHSAIWIPLRTRNTTFGLALVAYARSAVHPDMEALRSRGDEIALAIRHHRESARAQSTAEELRAQLHLSRAILCGVSADSMLPQIARAARLHLRAEFIAIGRGSEPPVSGDGWDGPAERAAAIHQGPLLQLWRNAFYEGREFELAGEATAMRKGNSLSSLTFSAPVSAAEALGRVIAIPLEVSGRICGVVMAGLPPGEESSEDLARLESYVLLASSALDREFAREQNRAGQKSLRKVIEESHERLAVIDAKGILRDASRSAAALLFLPWGRRGGTRIEDCFAYAGRNAVSEWCKWLGSREQEPVYGTASERHPVSLEAALHGGSIVRIHVRSEIGGASGEPSHWVIQFEDVSEQQVLRDGQGRLEVEMAGLMDSIESGILVADSAGNIRTVSSRLGAILGFECRRLLDLGNIGALIDAVAVHFARPVETAARWRDHVRRGEEASWDEFELVRPSRRIVERFARPLSKPNGERVGWLEVYRDVTGQRLIQSKLLQTEKMAALGQLVSGIAHELNNPLTSIQGYAQLLMGRKTGSDRGTHGRSDQHEGSDRHEGSGRSGDHSGDIRRISVEAERAVRIVRNLLLFSRETKPERRAVNVNEVIERTLSLRAYELKLENIEVELSLDVLLPNTLADAAQLQQVVLNLIVNAEQSITFGRREDVADGRILIQTRRLPGDRIEMRISDDGPGISAEIVQRIFDPFFTTKPPGVGTGLGLSIVYGIIQEHGGEVSVESKLGQGATLTVELPALIVPSVDMAKEGLSSVTAARSGTAPVPLVPRAAVSRRRILVVEDEPTVAQLIADVLSEEGHHVDMLLDSREAIGKLEETDYALLVCDLKMPHIDGPGLYRALVRRSNPSQRKILFVTGDTMSPRTLEFLKSSGLPYLAKPFLVEELKEAVGQALSVLIAQEIPGAAEWPRSAARGK